MINEEHENLVKIIGVFDDDKLEEAYMIMELCDGSLKEYD
jgi:serine/threonine protein kinase